MGDAGRVGIRGETGLPGVTGPTGYVGADGKPGEAGADGAPVSFLLMFIFDFDRLSLKFCHPGNSYCCQIIKLFFSAESI